MKINSLKEYQQQYQMAAENPQEFWRKIASNFHWFKDFDEVFSTNYEKGEISWFKDGKTNIAYNCLEVNINKGFGDKIAIILEPNNPDDEVEKITYNELYKKTCQFANLLLANGVKKGDRVCFYMPISIKSAIAMLACARIGAIHNVVFAGFSAKALAQRINDSCAKILITSDSLTRGEKVLNLYEIAKEALKDCKTIEKVILDNKNTKNPPKNIVFWNEIEKQSEIHECEELSAEDLLFILYTSGSTGNPKGVMHSHGGYMVYAGYSFLNVFNYQKDDIFFCTADIGWITGHSYVVYGALLNAATTLMFEGVPTFPTPSRFWQIIDKHKVNIFYTAPTAIRALMQKGDEFVQGHDLSSLKTLGSVGEPINEEAWRWYHQKIGKEKCDIVDTWWQTETGGIMISSLAFVTKSKASFAGTPLPGIVPILLDEDGNETKNGNLCLKQPWPSMIRGIWGDKEKFYNTYFKRFKGHYFAGDGAYQDENGLYRIIGRVDDVINVSGHRLGTAEIENIVNLHPQISESAVIGFPHEIKGEGICIFAIARSKEIDEKNICNEINDMLKKEIGAIAKADKIYILQDLPKTRSGKIMRRILKKILAKDSDFGDVSTLLNPEVVDLVRKNIN